MEVVVAERSKAAPEHKGPLAIAIGVTGAAGFIGSQVAAGLLEAGHKVLSIDDLSGGSRQNIPEGADFEEISINDDLDSLFRTYKPNYVYHLAAYAAEGLSHHIPLFNYKNNVLGTVNVLNASHHAGATSDNHKFGRRTMPRAGWLLRAWMVEEPLNDRGFLC